MKNFLGKRLLFITAHPDDESYMSAGTIYQNYQAGGQTMLLCASWGEKGRSHLKKPPVISQLKKLRRKELKRAAKFLHIKPVLNLALPDGKLKNYQKIIFQKGLAFAKKHRPDFMISFGQDGISGHIDHITAGKIAKQIAKKLNIPFIAAALPPSITKKALKWLATRRKAGHYVKSVIYKKPNIKIVIDNKIKKKALRIHQSQMDHKNAFTGFPAYAVKELLKAEYFVG